MDEKLVAEIEARAALEKRADAAEQERDAALEQAAHERANRDRLAAERDHWMNRWQGASEELDALRATNCELHRRAQRLEGIEARLARIRAGYERYTQYVERERRRARSGAQKQFRVIYDALRAAGFPYGKSTGHKYAAGLIDMLGAERDALRARLASLEAAAREVCATVGHEETERVHPSVQRLERVLRGKGATTRYRPVCLDCGTPRDPGGPCPKCDTPKEPTT